MDNTKKTMFRVLSIDGGGIKGLIPLFFLDLLEKLTGKPIYDLFQFFSGTSIGGIISIFLSQRIYTAGQLLVKMLGQLKNEIFPKKRIASFIFSQDSLYDPNLIEKILQDLIIENKEKILFKNSRGNFLITGSEVLTKIITEKTKNKKEEKVEEKKVESCEPFVFINYNNKHECYRVSFDPKKQDFFKFEPTDLKRDIYMWEIGRITSAAYPCFDFYKKIEGFDFLDGGYTYNNPSYLTIKYLEEIAKVDLKNVFMLSLGCNPDSSNQHIGIDFLKKSILRMGSEFKSNLNGMFDNMNNSAYSSLLLSDSYLGRRHVRIAPIKMKEIQLDSVDPKNIILIQKTARQMIMDYEDLTIPICKELTDFQDSKKLMEIAKRSKYFIIPRFYKYKEYYQSIDKLINSEQSYKDHEDLYAFDFPDNVKENEKIYKFSKNAEFFSFVQCGCDRDLFPFSFASLALTVGHLNILEKCKDQISDIFSYKECNVWTPFHYAAANGEIAGLLILLENEYLVPKSLKLYENCYNIEFKSDLGIEKFKSLRDAFFTYNGTVYNRQEAKKIETPYYYCKKNGKKEFKYFVNEIEKIVEKMAPKSK